MSKFRRNLQDSTFRMLFNEKGNAIELYNALTGSCYQEDVSFKTVTLENAIMGDIKNDVSFVIDGKFIVLIEHQSTINPNMPFRMLCYIAREYEKHYYNDNVYGEQPIIIPTPELYVFYNGSKNAELEEELKLSDLYKQKCDKMAVEVIVKMININHDKGGEILSRSKTLYDYSYFMYLIRCKRKQGMEKEDAIEEAIRECTRKNILKEFLIENGGEIVGSIFKELTREECEAIREQDGYFRGSEDTTKMHVKKMKSLNIPIEQIIEITGLTKEEIEEL